MVTSNLLAPKKTANKNAEGPLPIIATDFLC